MSVNSSKKVIRKSYSDIRLKQMKPMVFSASRGIPSLEEMHVVRNEKARGGEVSYVHSVKQTVRKSAFDGKKSTVHSVEKLSSRSRTRKQNCQSKSSDKKLFARKSGSYDKVNCQGQAKLVTSSDTSLSARRKPISDKATKTSTKPKATVTDKKSMHSAIKSTAQHRVDIPAKAPVGTSKQKDSRKEPPKCMQTPANQAASCPKSLTELAQRIVSTLNVPVTSRSYNTAPCAVKNVKVIANSKWNTDLDYDWFNTYSLPDINELKPNAKASEFEKWQRGERKDCPEMCVKGSLFLQEVFVVVDRDGKSRFVDKNEDKHKNRSTFGSVVMGVMKNLFGMHDYLQANSVWVV